MWPIKSIFYPLMMQAHRTVLQTITGGVSPPCRRITVPYAPSPSTANVDNNPFVAAQMDAAVDAFAGAVAEGGQQQASVGVLERKDQFRRLGSQVEGDDNFFLARLAHEHQQVAFRRDRPIAAEVKRPMASSQRDEPAVELINRTLLRLQH